MVLRILKIIVTSVFLTALECTKFVFGRGSAPYPTGELTALPIPSIWFKGPYFSGGKGEEEGKEIEKGKRKGMGGTSPPYTNSWIRP